MAAGLQVFNANGQLIVDLTTRMSRLIEVIDPGLSDGSKAFPSVNNSIAAILSDYSAAQSGSGGAGALPVVSVSGNTVSWTFNGAAQQYRMYSKILVFGY